MQRSESPTFALMGARPRVVAVHAEPDDDSPPEDTLDYTNDDDGDTSPTDTSDHTANNVVV